MKVSQWVVAGAVLVVMVFLVTFGMNYLGGLLPGRKSGPLPTVNVAELFFPVEKYPMGGEEGSEQRIESELRKRGYHDFWFTNDTNETVVFGLDRANCQCASVEAYLAPEGFTASTDQMKDATWGEKTVAELGDKVNAVELEQKTTLEAPAGRVGWVRVYWKPDQAGPRRIVARVWYDHKESGKGSVLETQILVQEPLQVDNDERSFPDAFSAARTKQDFVVLAYSATRPDLKLKTRLSPKRENDPIRVTRVERVKPEDMKVATEQIIKNRKERGKDVPSQVRCAYRVVIEGATRSPDGKEPLETGSLFRRLEIFLDGSETGEDFPPQFVSLTGKSQGDVEIVVTEKEHDGGIFFTPFPKTQKVRGRATLRSAIPGLELEVDEGRTWNRLKVKFVRTPPPDEKGQREWQIEAEIAADTVNGKFPRDEEGYRDPAVYLRTKGPVPQIIRVPVRGRADG